MTTLHLIFAWLSAPAHFVIWWPLFTAACSLGYTALDATSLGHKVLQTLASLGLDLPKLLVYFKSIFTGGSGGAGSADATQKRDVPSVPPRGTSVMRYGMIAALCISIPWLPLLVTGCLGPKGAADTGALVTCVLAQVNAGQTSFEDIATACGADAVSEVVDIISAILLAEQPDGGAAPSSLHEKLAAVHHKAAVK